MISVALSNKIFNDQNFIRNLCPANDGRKWFFCIMQYFFSTFTSPSINKPNILLSAGKNFAITAVEACARCAVPNASFTYTSPSLLNFSANASRLFLLLYKNEDFPVIILRLVLSMFAVSIACSPIQSLANKTCVLPRSISNSCK